MADFNAFTFLIDLISSQAAGLVGAALVLIGFAGQSLGKLNAKHMAYNVINLIGSGLLFAVALAGHQVGFAVLNGSWILVSAWGVSSVLRKGALAKG
jgi:hypothetical protein